MIRPTLVAFFVCSGLFIALINAVRALPSPETDAVRFHRAMFACDPCAFHLTPGVTTLNQVDAILRANKWVGTFRMQRGMEYDSGIIEWTWSGRQPDFIDARFNGLVQIQRGMVTAVQWTSRYALADLCAIAPNNGQVELVGSQNMSIRVQFYDTGIRVQSPTTRLSTISLERQRQVVWLRAMRQNPVIVRNLTMQTPQTNHKDETAFLCFNGT